MVTVQETRTAAPWGERRRVAPVRATGGMVASANPLVTATGLDVLRRGGNAVDAAVAAGLVASVVLPEMCGLGGDLFAIVADAGAKQATAFLGSGIAPRGASYEQMLSESPGQLRMPYQGPLSIGVPGMVSAYHALLKHGGSRSFAVLAEPAVGYAEHGHPISLGLSEAIRESRPLIERFPSTAAVFLSDGETPVAGTPIRQPDLARTLRAIGADGPETFYRGEIAERLAAAVQELGGSLTVDDLAGHETVVTEPIAIRYRGHTVWQTGLPSQGLIHLEALNILAASGDPGRHGDEAWVHRQVEATKLAFADRLQFARDPQFGPTPVDTLLSDRWAALRAARISDRAIEEVPSDPLADGDTTYLCVVDGSGLMVSLIQSVSSAFGSGIVAGDTGVVLNNRVGRGFTLEPGHPNCYAPGKKTMHTINCFAIGDEEGTPVVVGGTPGGDGQPQWNLQLVSALLDAGLDPQAAIDAPRWTVWPGTDPMNRPNPFELRIEDRAGDGVIAALEGRGHRIRRMGSWGGGGDGQVIHRDPAIGTMTGGSDPRGEGQVHGF